VKISNFNFPHPVLFKKGNDYESSSFDAYVNIKLENSNYKIECNFELDNKTLIGYLKSNKVSFGIHVECFFTQYREIFITQKYEKVFEIDSNKLDGNVEIVPLIIASEKIHSFITREATSIFDGLSFDIDKGDILGFTDQVIFKAEKNIKNISNMKSIVEVRKNPGKEIMTLDLMGSKIIIFLNEEIYDIYQEVQENQDIEAIIISTLAVPALIEVIEDIKRDGRGEGYGRWYDVLESRLEKVGYSVDSEDFEQESSSNLVQLIIGKPLLRAYKDLKRFDINDIL